MFFEACPYRMKLMVLNEKQVHGVRRTKCAFATHRKTYLTGVKLLQTHHDLSQKRGSRTLANFLSSNFYNFFLDCELDSMCYNLQANDILVPFRLLIQRHDFTRHSYSYLIARSSQIWENLTIACITIYFNN